MKAEKVFILEYLATRKAKFIIPVYQRDYLWKKSNCEKLWQDLLELPKNKRESHFFGSIVEVNSRIGLTNENLIIDGQQRLTTVSLLIIAIVNYLKNQKLKNSQVEEYEEFLINKWSEEDVKIRLKPNKQDKKHFEKLFENRKIDKANIDSNIVSNYCFFYDKISQNEIDIDELFLSLNKLEIVLVSLEKPKDDPQLIFESLNSTGVDLTASDLIRNYILMDLEPKEQEKQYEKYWLKIEELTSDISEFIRHFLQFYFETNIKKNSVYQEFQKFREKAHLSKSQILEELLKYAIKYNFFIQEHSDKDINKRLENIRDLDSTILYPYLFDVFDLFEDEKLSKNDVLEILKFLESYSFRKSLSGDTKGVIAMILSLKKEIRKQPDWQKNYLEIFKAILISKTTSQKFPIDEDFEKFLSEVEVYKMRNNKFLMSSIEHHNCAYEIDLEDLEIEHIIPQNAAKWKKMLGDNWQEIQKKYLNTIGNLSLTSSKKNKEMSNKDFLSKQNVDYQTSKLKLSKNLSEGEIWNEEKIKERADWLIAIAKKVWPYPTSSYKIKSENQPDFFSLQEFENDNITKAAPFLIEIKIENKKIPVKNWRNVIEELLKIFHEFSPTDFKRISNMARLERLFNKAKEGKSFFGEIRNNIVVGYEINVNQSAISIIENLKKICEEINFDKEILIYYKPKESK
jgi:uncharacterized protein with ParB-like and HNH nuclease domain